ncbi:MAG: heavy-metal-associated domain-containing protein [Anaerolineae bacterium]|nr:heavy-metal-associated domain-containing protein [Anaerolineae bacterium]
METKTVKIDAIGCDGCVRTIQGGLKEVAGVTDVKGDVTSKQVTIHWDAPATWENITAKLVEIEYPVTG